MPQETHIYIDETGTHEEAKYFILASVETDSASDVNTEIKNFLSKINKNIDLFLNVPSLQGLYPLQHLHFCEDYQDIQFLFVDLMKTLDIRIKIAFMERKTDFCIESAYLKLISKLLHGTLTKKTATNTQIFLEQLNEKQGQFSLENKVIKELRAKRILQTCIHDIKDHAFTIEKVDKSNLFISLPDYACAIFSKAIGSSEGSYPRRYYNSISGKIRIIYDVDRDFYFSRKKIFPFHDYDDSLSTKG